MPASESLRCLHEVFEFQVDLRPEAPALICGEEVLTYRQLDEQSNRLAQYLRICGIGAGHLVGLFMEKSARPIVSILGCLKAGAGYVPIDPVHPAERIRHIAEEAELKLMLTEQALADRASVAFPGERLQLDNLDGELTRMPSTRLSCQDTGVTPKDLCYVIFTSGTTGRPKGVMAEHRNVVRFIDAFNEVCSTTPEDRVYQGFSLGFDGSVEEIWMAFSNGAALVAGNRDTPKFGNDLAHFMTRNRVTYFSTVPTMLSTIGEDIPSLRQLVVSGERCPPELVSRWARNGRVMLNVYGPTETTVNATALECRPGRPITIGKPLAGYHTHVLDEKMRPLPAGEKGELFIGGSGVSRGYLKRPDLTSHSFVYNPYLKKKLRVRLYRTGDLASIREDGEIEFFGRLDGQVKIRGYRVELSEIEAVLIEQPGVRSAAVTLYEGKGLQELAAYVIPQQGAVDRSALREALRKKLPDYMVPKYLDAVTELPMLASGKVDRRKLPDPASLLVEECRQVAQPETPLEVTISDAWKAVFGAEQVSVEDDFFLDLGGYSLLAAQLVTKLRSEAGVEVNIRDVYRHPTIRRLAAALGEEAGKTAEKTAAAGGDNGPGAAARNGNGQAPRPSAKEVFASVPILVRWCCAALQLLSICVLNLIAVWPVLLLIVVALAVYRDVLSLLQALLIVVGLSVLAWPLNLTMSIVLKWLIVGRYKPGAYPLWGLQYFRYWFASHLQGISGASIFIGTPIMPLYLRLLGARIGRNVSIETGDIGAYDLLSIGDETSICAETQINGYRVEDGMLIIGSADIGRRCFVGIHSTLGLNVKMEDDCRLDDMSMLPDGAVMKTGESRRGSPAQPATVTLPEPPDGRAVDRKPFRYALLHLLAAYFVSFVASLIGLVFLAPLILVYWKGGLFWTIAFLLIMLPLSVPLGVPVFCFYVAGLKSLIMGRAKPGVYPLASLDYVRRWLADGLMVACRKILLPLYTTIYLPPFFRLLGAKIGPWAELSTVWKVTPELLEASEESFFADGCMLGGRRTHRGQFQIDVNRVGRRTFVGNNAILPPGASLGDNCLLGVVSTTPEGAGQAVPSGTELLGSPSFKLPYRKKVEGFDDSVTYRPTRKLYLLRAFIDGLRVVIPGYIALFIFAAWIGLLVLSFLSFGVFGMILLTAPIGLALMIVRCCIVTAIKWVVMGRFKPVIKPLWSPYVWLNEMVNGIYESIMAPALNSFLGTPFVVPFLRMMGIKVGKSTYIESVLFSEFDLVEIGNYAALNAGAIVQTHLFEDRIMKSSFCRIGEGCALGNMAVLLYDTTMQPGSTLGPLSLVMKGETLAAGTRWHGVPNVRCPDFHPVVPRSILKARHSRSFSLAPAGSRHSSGSPAVPLAGLGKLTTNGCRNPRRKFRSSRFKAHLEHEFADRYEFLRKAFLLLQVNGISGDYVQFGSSSADSFSMAYRLLSKHPFPLEPFHLWIFDSFNLRPASRANGNSAHGAEDCDSAACLQEFHRVCKRRGIPRAAYTAVPGEFDETLHPATATPRPQDVRCAYIHSKTHVSTKAALRFLMPLMKHGMIIAFDDYYRCSPSSPSGQRLAMAEAFMDHSQWRLLPYLPIGGHGMSFMVEAASPGMRPPNH